MGMYGIIWNDDLDLEEETVYEEGKTVRIGDPAPNVMVGQAVIAAKAKRDVSQKELSQRTGIDQSEISKIEQGFANPSVDTLERIALALDANLVISME